MDDYSEFHTKADTLLEALVDAVEAADQAGMVDIELLSGICTITLESGQQYVINKHEPTRQLWVSSPVSGAVHYRYDAASDNWQDGENMFIPTLRQELQQLTNITLGKVG